MGGYLKDTNMPQIYSVDKATIERFRMNLPTIRNVVGWSSEYLALLLGVSRPTIVRLENTKNTMTKIQYLAIRALFQEQIVVNNNKTLENVLKILVDSNDISEKNKQKIRNQIAMIVKTVGRKVGSVVIGKTVSKNVEDIVEKVLKECE